MWAIVQNNTIIIIISCNHDKNQVLPTCLPLECSFWNIQLLSQSLVTHSPTLFYIRCCQKFKISAIFINQSMIYWTMCQMNWYVFIHSSLVAFANLTVAMLSRFK